MNAAKETDDANESRTTSALMSWPLCRCAEALMRNRAWVRWRSETHICLPA